jgi:teichuronic acid biosynthesis glycosyltransferase TuaC
MPNVLLESLACGTPVIATAVGGNPEIVTSPEAGILVAERTPEALCDAYERLMRNRPNATATRRHAEGFGWAPTVQGLLELFRSALAVDDHPGRPRAATPESARQP